MYEPSAGVGPTNLASRVRLNQGVEMPWLGIGVFQSDKGRVTERAVRWALDEMPWLGVGPVRSEHGRVTERAVRWALEAGYRLIDTAAVYRTEADVGRAVRASGIPREEVFVATKLWFKDQGYENALRAGRRSVARLGLGYIDLYLIHMPRARTPKARLDTWRAFEELQEEGVCRAIGVSNYSVRYLEELREHCSVLPAVDQVEFHPWVYDPNFLAYVARHGIRPEAYCPLTRGRSLGDPVLGTVAEAHGRSPAQVLIRWGLQHGIVEIPKSSHRERILENAAVFDFALSTDEMRRLDGLRGGPRVIPDPAAMG